MRKGEKADMGCEGGGVRDEGEGVRDKGEDTREEDLMKEG